MDVVLALKVAIARLRFEELKDMQIEAVKSLLAESMFSSLYMHSG